MTKESTGAAPRALKVLSTVGVQGLLEELAPEFERATGHKVAITFNVVKLFKEQILAGADFDVGFFSDAVTDDLIKAGKIAADTRTNIGRSGVGFAVRAGAAKPDIGTVDALKRTLLAAQSIVYPKDGISGVYFAEIVKNLGIDEAMKPKTILDTSGGLVGGRVASGEAQYAVQLVSELTPVRGCDVVGPIPQELQRYVVLTAGVSANAKSADAAKALLAFVTAPAAVAVMKAKGLDPL